MDAQYKFFRFNLAVSAQSDVLMQRMLTSVAHTVGRRPYSTSISARDSWISALLTMGEGYHNSHHRFPGDYRNG